MTNQEILADYEDLEDDDFKACLLCKKIKDSNVTIKVLNFFNLVTLPKRIRGFTKHHVVNIN